MPLDKAGPRKILDSRGDQSGCLHPVTEDLMNGLKREEIKGWFFLQGTDFGFGRGDKRFVIKASWSRYGPTQHCLPLS